MEKENGRIDMSMFIFSKLKLKCHSCFLTKLVKKVIGQTKCNIDN